MIEAVFEDMGVKREIFETLDKVTRPGAILASNTSYLDINEIVISDTTGKAEPTLVNNRIFLSQKFLEQ